MSDTTGVPAVPPGMEGLIPHLVCGNAAGAIDFYQRAFGAEELARLPGPDGRIMHALMRLGGAMFMLNDEYPEMQCVGPQTLGGTPLTLHRYVEDVDAAVDHAVRAGARIVMPVADMFWGDRYGVLEDPWGHRWSLATHKQDQTPAQTEAAMQQACSGQ